MLRLFATLDPTLRRVHLPSGQEAILSDTVGFISDLPHQLVNAFKVGLLSCMCLQTSAKVHEPDHQRWYTASQLQGCSGILTHILPTHDDARQQQLVMSSQSRMVQGFPPPRPPIYFGFLCIDISIAGAETLFKTYMATA